MEDKGIGGCWLDDDDDDFAQGTSGFGDDDYRDDDDRGGSSYDDDDFKGAGNDDYYYGDDTTKAAAGNARDAANDGASAMTGFDKYSDDFSSSEGYHRSLGDALRRMQKEHDEMQDSTQNQEEKEEEEKKKKKKSRGLRSTREVKTAKYETKSEEEEKEEAKERHSSRASGMGARTRRDHRRNLLGFAGTPSGCGRRGGNGRIVVVSVVYGAARWVKIDLSNFRGDDVNYAPSSSSVGGNSNSNAASPASMNDLTGVNPLVGQPVTRWVTNTGGQGAGAGGGEDGDVYRMRCDATLVKARSPAADAAASSSTNRTADNLRGGSTEQHHSNEDEGKSKESQPLVVGVDGSFSVYFEANTIMTFEVEW